ncbi:MAG: RNA polymerase sigma factor RpoD/SigA [bacterium]
MSELEKTMQPLLKRARVKKGKLALDDIYDFLENSEGCELEEVLDFLEKKNVEIDEDSNLSGFARNHKSSLQIYMQEIARIDLLDATEEIELSKKLHEARDEIYELCDEYGVEAAEEKELILKSSSKDLIRELLREHGITDNKLSGFMQRLNRHKKHYVDAHSEMVRSNLRLVVTIAKKYQHCGLSFDDLINEGNMGLMKAVDRYDYRRGFRFSTYAAWWIRQAVLRAISNKARTIRLPVYMIDLVRKWKTKKRQLQQQLGRQPHMMEVADALNIDYEKAVHIMRHSQAPASLETPVGENADAELKDLIEASSETETEHRLDEQMMREKLWQAIDEELTEKEKIVFTHRYGLKGSGEMTLEEVGNILDLTRERIRQIQRQALEKIKKSSYGEELRDFLSDLNI